jgi:hypothetical protein
VSVLPITERDILLAYKERKVARGEKVVRNYLDPTFKLQSDFIADPAKLKVLLCTRRSGKSFGDGLYLFKEADENPGVSVIYVALTRETAEKTMWKDVLKVIDAKYKVGAKFNETKLTATLPNGSIIYLLGVDSAEDEKKKLLGQKYKLAIVDEPQSMSIDLNDLTLGVLGPAVADYRGTICMTGTPGNLKAGLFFDLTQGQDPQEPGTWECAGWKGYRWSAFQNPYMAEEWKDKISSLEAANPRIKETPIYQQHYLGRWVIDDSRLVYRYQPGRNDYQDLPAHPRGRWHHVLGVDLGYNDPSAFVLVSYHDHDPNLYVRSAWKKSSLDVTDVATRIRTYTERYDIDAIVIDNANKQAVEEMKNRFSLPLTPANKTGKADFIEIMNGEFIQGKIKFSPDCKPLADEMTGLVWDERVLPRKEEHPACPNHCSDAVLYSWRFCYQYLSSTLEGPPPKEGTREWADAEVRRMEEQEEEELRMRVAERGVEGVGDSSSWDYIASLG